MTAENSTADPADPADPAVARRPPARGASSAVRAIDQRLLESRLPLGARPARNAVIGAGLIAYAWFLAGTAPFSMKALVGVLVPGAVLGVIAYARPPERIPPPESLDVTGISYWIIWVVLLFEWEASAFRSGSHPWHPSLTGLVNTDLISSHPIKAAAVVVWLLAGWNLVKR